MKYCYQCGKLTQGDPLYCSHCGRTYDVKLCSRQHVNPRGAEVCSKCGSRELSTPQPKVPLTLRLLAILARLGLGVLLFYLSLTLIVDALRSPQVQQTFIAVGMLLSILWWIWSKLPDWLQEAIRSFWVRRHDDGD